MSSSTRAGLGATNPDLPLHNNSSKWETCEVAIATIVGVICLGMFAIMVGKGLAGYSLTGSFHHIGANAMIMMAVCGVGGITFLIFGQCR